MDLENLFKFTRELPILNEKGEQVVIGKKKLVLYQRIIGDAELTTARKKALKASRILRKELATSESENAQALIPDYNEVDDDTLVRMIILADSLDIRRLANSRAQKPKEPKKLKSDASLEQQEEYEHAMEEWPKKVSEAIDKEITSIIELRTAELNKLDRDAKLKLFIESTIEGLCRTEMLRIFNSWCTYLGTYADKPMTQRAFKSFPSFDNASSELKEQVIRGYVELDISGEDLKN